MTPILCISKSDMPRMMYELGKASNVYFDTILAVICFIIMIFFIVKSIENIKYKSALFSFLFCAIVFFACGFSCAKSQYDHNKQYQFSNFTYNQPAKFVLQYYTVTTSKQYKFIAETEHNVFIKGEK